MRGHRTMEPRRLDRRLPGGPRLRARRGRLALLGGLQPVQGRLRQPHRAAGVRRRDATRRRTCCRSARAAPDLPAPPRRLIGAVVHRVDRDVAQPVHARSHRGPVRRSTPRCASEACTYLPEGDLYLVSRFDDVKQLLLDHHVYSSRNVGGERGAADPDLVAAGDGGFRSVAVLTPADPPEHTWYRRLVTRQFAPDGVRQLHDSIERIVETADRRLRRPGLMRPRGRVLPAVPALRVRRADGHRHRRHPPDQGAGPTTGWR